MNTSRNNKKKDLKPRQAVGRGAPACRHKLAGLTFLLGTMASMRMALAADIVTDGTMGGANTLTGGHGDILASWGTGAGSNLFHSFTTFNIDAGKTATFQNSGSTYSNVISRVTGGSASNINGTLASQIPNVYFINPNGVVFGAGAVVNVPGSFHVSTADKISIGGGEFNLTTNAATASTLTVDPTAFGFTSTPANITITGSQLSVGAGKTLTLAGGDITIEDSNGSGVAGGTQAVLSAPEGQVNITSLGAAYTGEICVSSCPWGAPNRLGPAFTTDQLAAQGGTLTIDNSKILSEADSSSDDSNRVNLQGKTVNILNGSEININQAVGNETPYPGVVTIRGDVVNLTSSTIRAVNISDTTFGGWVDIYGHDINISNGQILAQATGTTTGGATNGIGGDIQLTADTAADSSGGTIDITGTDSLLKASTSGAGEVGHIYLTADKNINLSDGDIEMTGTSATTNYKGTGSQLKITSNGGNVSLTNFDINTSVGAGAAGTSLAGTDSVAISIQSNSATGKITLSGTDIVNNSNAASSGPNITLNADEIDININNINTGSTITANNYSGAPGGAITLDAYDGANADKITINASTLETSAKAGSEGTTGTAGAIDLDAGAGDITLTSATLESNAVSSAAQGAAGVISLATNSVDEGDITITGGTISTTAPLGDGGIDIDADAVSISGANLKSDAGISGVSGNGNAANFAGSIDIYGAESVTLSNADISSNTYNATHGGDIDISGARVYHHDTGTITADVYGSGDGGNIWIHSTAPDSVNYDVLLGDTGNWGDIYARANSGTGDAGSIEIDGYYIAIQGYTWIKAESYTSGQAGSIDVDAVNNLDIGLTTTNPTKITSSAYSTGPGGAIELSAGNDLTIQDGAQILLTTSGGGLGGFLDIDAGRDLNIRDAGTTIDVSLSNGSDGEYSELTAARYLDIFNGADILNNIRTSTGINTSIGGDMRLSAGQELLVHGSGTTVQANVGGDSGNTYSITNASEGGDIWLDAPRVSIFDSAVVSAAMSSTVTGTNAVGGSVLIGSNTNHNPGTNYNTTLNLGVARSWNGTTWVDGASDSTFTLTAANSGAGTGGSLSFYGQSITIGNGVTLDATNSGIGTGGSINLDAAGTTVSANGVVDAAGNAGTIYLQGGSQIDLQATNGTGGGLNITASEDLVIDGASTDIDASVSNGATGGFAWLYAGDVLQVSNGADITNEVLASGGIGSGMVLTGNHQLNITGTGTDVSADVSGTGTGGSIWLNGPSYNISGGATVSTDATAGTGGSIFIGSNASNNPENYFNNDSLDGVTGTNNTIYNPNLIFDGDLDNNGTVDNIFLTATASGTGTGGNISLFGATIKLEDGFRISAENTGSGQGGSITLNATGTVDILSGATLSALSSGGTGGSGSVNVTAGGPITVDGSKDTGYWYFNWWNWQWTWVPTGKQYSSINVANGSTSTSQGGSITLAAPAITVSDGAILDATNLGGGNSGSINLTATDTVSILTGGSIRASNNGAGTGGSVNVTADDSITVAGYQDQGYWYYDWWTGTYQWIVNNQYSNIDVTNSANTTRLGGSINLTSAAIFVQYGGVLSADNLGNGNSGSISLTAADTVSLLTGGTISATNSGAGIGGSVNVTAGDSITVDGFQDQGYWYFDWNSWSYQWNTANQYSGISVASKSTSTNTGGSINLTAPAITISNGAGLDADNAGGGNSGSINLTATDTVSLLTGGTISATNSGAGLGGSVNVTAGDSITVDGSTQLTEGYWEYDWWTGTYQWLNQEVTQFTEISTTSGNSSTGPGGSINLSSVNIFVSDGGTLSADNLGDGAGGSINLNATNAVSVLTGSQVSATNNGAGIGGSVNLSAGNSILVDGSKTLASGYWYFDWNTWSYLWTDTSSTQSSAISVASSGTAPGGSIHLAAPEIQIRNSGKLSADNYGSGDGGAISLISNLSEIAGGTISASTHGVGDAGSIDITAPTINVLGGGQILGVSDGAGLGGSINLTGTTLIGGAGSMLDATANGSGAGGEINIFGPTTINGGGSIHTDANGAGTGGDILLSGDVYLSDTGTSISAETSGSAHGGTISLLNGNTVDIRNGAIVTANTTTGTGAAGSVTVSASQVSVDNAVVSAASVGTDSSGQTGNIDITAGQWLHLANSATISIENDAVLADSAAAAAITPGTITVTAPDIDMQDSEITTNSTGNVSAGNIVINFSHWLTMDPSYITTTAQDGNGGSITINGGELIWLQNSGFQTTVLGPTGNGGNISVTADILLMETGLIQANAQAGNGGDITLDLGLLLPSGSSLFMGGSTPIAWQPFVFGFNVIQAASQAGVSGNINSTTPQLNLSGVLASLGGPQFDTSSISQDYCAVGTGSTLTRKGNGALPQKSGDLLVF